MGQWVQSRCLPNSNEEIFWPIMVFALVSEHLLKTKALDEEKYVLSVFLDLSKTFNIVNHSILLSKLDIYAI